MVGNKEGNGVGTPALKVGMRVGMGLMGGNVGDKVTGKGLEVGLGVGTPLKGPAVSTYEFTKAGAINKVSEDAFATWFIRMVNDPAWTKEFTLD